MSFPVTPNLRILYLIRFPLDIVGHRTAMVFCGCSVMVIQISDDNTNIDFFIPAERMDNYHKEPVTTQSDIATNPLRYRN